jgi:hypothetical protein
MNNNNVKIIALLLMVFAVIIIPSKESFSTSNHSLLLSWTNPNASRNTETKIVEEVWDHWVYEDLKGLDPWGESEFNDMDFVAIYEKEAPYLRWVRK